MHFVGLAAGGDFTLPADHCNSGRVAIFIHVNAKRSGLLNGESQVGSVNFVQIAFPQFADAEIHAAFRKAHLSDALVQIQEGHGGHAAKM